MARKAPATGRDTVAERLASNPGFGLAAPLAAAGLAVAAAGAAAVKGGGLIDAIGRWRDGRVGDAPTGPPSEGPGPPAASPTPTPQPAPPAPPPLPPPASALPRGSWTVQPFAHGEGPATVRPQLLHIISRAFKPGTLGHGNASARLWLIDNGFARPALFHVASDGVTVTVRELASGTPATNPGRPGEGLGFGEPILRAMPIPEPTQGQQGSNPAPLPPPPPPSPSVLERASEFVKDAEFKVVRIPGFPPIPIPTDTDTAGAVGHRTVEGAAITGSRVYGGIESIVSGATGYTLGMDARERRDFVRDVRDARPANVIEFNNRRGPGPITRFFRSMRDSWRPPR